LTTIEDQLREHTYTRVLRPNAPAVSRSRKVHAIRLSGRTVAR